MAIDHYNNAVGRGVIGLLRSLRCRASAAQLAATGQKLPARFQRWPQRFNLNGALA